MDRENHQSPVVEPVADLPEEFLSQLANVDVVAQGFPTAGQLARSGLRRGHALLGLYGGVARIEIRHGAPGQDRRLPETH